MSTSITTLSELELPKSNVQRSIKAVIGNKMVQKEARVAIGKAVVVFVSYLTCRAHSASTSRSFTKAQIEAALVDCGFESDFLSLIEEKYKQHIERQSLKKIKATSSIDAGDDDDNDIIDEKNITDNDDTDNDDDNGIGNESNRIAGDDDDDDDDDETQMAPTITEQEDDMKDDN